MLWLENTNLAQLSEDPDALRHTYNCECTVIITLKQWDVCFVYADAIMRV